ncbi:MAG TPA: hypothetical protein VFD92_05315 [Candidatus Binatia bacterium]|nr:hypothetical protein [Candidatus Binatia bacterium]
MINAAFHHRGRARLHLPGHDVAIARVALHVGFVDRRGSPQSAFARLLAREDCPICATFDRIWLTAVFSIAYPRARATGWRPGGHGYLNDEIGAQRAAYPILSGGVTDAHLDLKIPLAHGGGYTARRHPPWHGRSEARVRITRPPRASCRRGKGKLVENLERMLDRTRPIHPDR